MIARSTHIKILQYTFAFDKQKIHQNFPEDTNYKHFPEDTNYKNSPEDTNYKNSPEDTTNIYVYHLKVLQGHDRPHQQLHTQLKSLTI